MIIH
jgi:hypothetical protein